jgi:uncharacterized protein (DUF1778 family)
MARGRPPLPADTRKEKTTIRLSAQDKALIEAARGKTPLTTFIRQAAVEKAQSA